MSFSEKNKKIDYEYIIIGFGASGIAAAIQLTIAKKSFKIIEKSDTYGGCWNHALPSSCLQTHRNFYKFASVEYDRGTSDFPNKLEVLNYFRKAIDYYKLFNRVEFNYTANFILKNNTWKVINLKNQKFYICKHILVCTGLNQIPSIPRLFSDSLNINTKMQIIHSKDVNNYLVNSKKIYNRIAIIGNGASCCDILKYFKCSPKFDITKTDIKIFYRTNKYFIPTTIKGIPGSFFLTNSLLKLFEFVNKKIFMFFLVLANIFVFKSYLPIPNDKINSYNIVGSKIIQQLIEKGNLSYHQEEIQDIDLKNKIIKTNDAIYSGIDLVILATGYKNPTLKLYEYVVPVNDENKIKKQNIGYIGFNRTYNFIENSEARTKWYIENNHLLMKKQKIGEINDWITKTKQRKDINNLDFLDSTYELFELY